MGRPAVEGETRTETVNVRVTPLLMHKIDLSRGDMSRSDWCRQAILRQVIHARADVVEED